MEPLNKPCMTKDLLRSFEVATVACRTELSNLSQDLHQHYFAKLPFEKSISVYSQNLWVTLWMTLGDSPLTWRGTRDFVTLPIFCNSTIVN
jgi:hypothetical protein